jgi:hypothetical protein
MTATRPGLFNALPDFAFSAVFLVTWIAPLTLGEQMVKWLLLVMLMEFIVIHSAAFMGSVALANEDRFKRSIGILGFGGFYTLFAGGFSLAFHSWWPITTFWGQTVNRLLGVIVGQVPNEDQKAFIMRGWAASGIFYLLGCFLTLLLPVPRLGLTPQVVAAQHITGGGAWVSQPQKVLAFGFLYFLLMGWSELSAHAWAGQRTPPSAKAPLLPSED